MINGRGRLSINGKDGQTNMAEKKENKNKQAALHQTGERQIVRDARPREVVIGEDREALYTGVTPETRRKPRVRTIRAKEKKHLPVSVVFFMVICTLLVMFMVMNYVQINEYTQQVSDLKRELNTLTSEKKELDLALEKKNDLTNIKNEAAALGMMEDKDLLTVHVNLEKEDKIESYETDDEDYGVITTVMSAIAQNFRSYWNNYGSGE